MAVALTAIFAAMGAMNYGNTFQVPPGRPFRRCPPSNISAGSAQFTLTVTAPDSLPRQLCMDGQTIATSADRATIMSWGSNCNGSASLVAKPEPAFVTRCNRILAAGTNGLSNPLISS